MKIGKEQITKFTSSKADRELLSHLWDQAIRANDREEKCCSNFLDERQSALAKRFFDFQKIPYWIEGETENSSKSIFWFYAPGKGITIFHFPNTGMTHSILLGTLFSFGLRLDQIGDIFVEEKDVYFTCLTSMESFFYHQFASLSGRGIQLEKVETLSLRENHLVRQVITVTSLRLDVVLAKLMKKSRSQIESLVHSEVVLHNYQPIQKMSDIVTKGDILSIRHVGKFRIGSVEGYSKKGSLFLEIFKYC